MHSKDNLLHQYLENKRRRVNSLSGYSETLQKIIAHTHR